jgi:hypothetical protein
LVTIHLVLAIVVKTALLKMSAGMMLFIMRTGFPRLRILNPVTGWMDAQVLWALT